MKDKKTYSEPQMTVHGNVEDITQLCHFMNRDLPHGNSNSAYPQVGDCS